jgi:cysteine desulfurase
MTDRIYLDFNASTPMAPEVIAAMKPFLDSAYGNPSSLHWAGIPAREAVEKARSQVAGLLGCDATEIVFTSGGTEANNHAIKGVFFSRREVRTRHIITSRIEHPAVLEPCRFLQKLGTEVSHLPVDRYGMVDPDEVRRAIRPGTILISVMHANNEVGSIQPIEEIARIARRHGILCHTDAAQSAGKIPIPIPSLGVDLLSVAGHKLYGPKGVGALFIRKGVELEPLLHGAGHECGRRAGTENVLEIVGLGAACELAGRWIDSPKLKQLRDRFWNSLQERLAHASGWYAAPDTNPKPERGQVVLNGHLERRLPNTLNVSFPGYKGGDILAKLPGVAASTGSACHAGSIHMSPVLAAMGVSEDVGLGAIRFSLGRNTTAEEVDAVVDRLADVVSKEGV